MRSLGLERVEEIAVKWFGLAAGGAVSLRRGVRYQRANRAFRLTFLDLPEQSILLAFFADNPLRILMNRAAIVQSLEVFLLRIRQTFANDDGLKLVLANTPEQNLLLILL